MKGVYPKAEEGMVDLLNLCKIDKSNVMLCLRCSEIFDKKAAKEVENPRQDHQRGRWGNKKPQFYFNKGVYPRRNCRNS